MSAENIPDPYADISHLFPEALSDEEDLLYARMDALSSPFQFDLCRDGQFDELVEVVGREGNHLAFRMVATLPEHETATNQPEPGTSILIRVHTSSGVGDLAAGDMAFVDGATIEGFSTPAHRSLLVWGCDLALRKVKSAKVVATIKDRTPKEIAALREAGLIKPMLDGRGEMLLVPSTKPIYMRGLVDGVHGPDQEPVFTSKDR